MIVSENIHKTKLLRVADVQVKFSPKVAEKMGTPGEYHIVTFETTDDVETIIDSKGVPRTVLAPVRRTSSTYWKDSPIPGQERTDFGATLKVGDYVKGDILTRKVKKYPIPSPAGNEFAEVNGQMVRVRYVTQATVPVLGDTADPASFELAVLNTFKQRQFFLEGTGDDGAPGGNVEAAMERDRTKLEGHPIEAQMPHGLREADAETIEDYSAESSTRNRQQDESRPQR